MPLAGTGGKSHVGVRQKKKKEFFLHGARSAPRRNVLFFFLVLVLVLVFIFVLAFLGF